MFALFIALGSCSKDDNSTPQKPNPDPTNPTNPDDPNNPNPEKTYYYKQKILVEDITSASCVWCPLASFTTEELAKTEYADKLITIGIHDDYDPSIIKDPFVIPGLNNLVLNIIKSQPKFGYPFISWNRDYQIAGGDFQYFIPKVKTGTVTQYTLDLALFKEFYTEFNLIAPNSPIGIKINSTLEKANGKVTFSLKFAQDLNQELKYVVYVLEDNLKFQQANRSTLYGNTAGTPRWEMNFIHNHVVRATNNFLGDAIDAKESVKDKEFTHSVDLSYTLDNITNASVVVAILDKNGKVLNAQIAKANATQDYEIVK